MIRRRAHYDVAVTTVLYLHGFASSPEGRKAAMLREILGPEGFRFVAPDLNRPSFEKLDFGAIVDAALGAARAEPPAVVVGSSLGALVALELARRGVTSPLVLVAPAFALASRWADRLPPGDPVRFFHHAELRTMPIHRAFFERMAAVEPERDVPPVPVTIVMGRDDESVPFDGVERVWRRWRASGRLRAGSEFVAVAGGDHGLTAFAPLLADAIRRRVSATP